MSTPLVQSFGQQLAELAAFIGREWQADSPEGMFALHVFEAAGETGPTAGWSAPVDLDAVDGGRAPALSVAGYRLGRLGSTPPDAAERWRAGLQRLSERNPFPPDRQAFPYRPLELYGLSYAASKLLADGSPERSWLAGVLSRLETASLTDLWARVLSRLAAALLGVRWSADWPQPEASQAVDELSVIRWVASVVEHTGKKGPDPRVVDGLLLKQAAITHARPADVARAAIIYHSVRRAVHERLQSGIAATWQVGRQTRDAVELVVNLCRRFHHFARQIRIRHGGRSSIEFNDEYDVQDAMHALLRLHFTDVRPEEWTPSYAGRSTRMNFLLKPERVVIEVKMTRRGLTQREVISELTEDKERYRSHPDCEALVCFVYDPANLCDNPTALETDVSVRDGDFRVEVVVAPHGI